MNATVHATSSTNTVSTATTAATRLAGKVAFIHGGSRGIGAATARRLGAWAAEGKSLTSTSSA